MVGRKDSTIPVLSGGEYRVDSSGLPYATWRVTDRIRTKLHALLPLWVSESLVGEAVVPPSRLP